MSRHDEFKQLVNPASKFIDWSSENKCFKFYKKSDNKDEKGENVLIDMPLGFLTLKQCYTIKGFHKTAEAGIFSNEVDSLEKEITVKYGNKIFLTKGKWAEIKEMVQSVGGKFCISVYAMLKSGELVNFQFYGASLGAWIDFTQKTKSRLPDEWVMIAESRQDKTGGIKYNVPVFKFAGSIARGSEYDVKAESAYNQINEYLKEYFAKNIQIVAEEVVVPDNTEAIHNLYVAHENRALTPLATQDQAEVYEDELPF